MPRSRHLFQNSDGSLNMQTLCLESSRGILQASKLGPARGLLTLPKDESHCKFDAGGHGRVLCGSGNSTKGSVTFSAEFVSSEAEEAEESHLVELERERLNMQQRCAGSKTFPGSHGRAATS